MMVASFHFPSFVLLWNCPSPPPSLCLFVCLFICWVAFLLALFVCLLVNSRGREVIGGGGGGGAYLVRRFLLAIFLSFSPLSLLLLCVGCFCFFYIFVSFCLLIYQSIYLSSYHCCLFVRLSRCLPVYLPIYFPLEFVP